VSSSDSIKRAARWLLCPHCYRRLGWHSAKLGFVCTVHGVQLTGNGLLRLLGLSDPSA
jgi:hypothetical protein